jgi:hypothetical protein
MGMGCSNTADNFVSSQNARSDWSYICCTIRNGSQCYEKNTINTIMRSWRFNE